MDIPPSIARLIGKGRDAETVEPIVVTQTPAKQSFEGGATRSETPIRTDLIPSCGILRIGRRYGLGAIEHGEHNWKGGGREFIKSTINHMEIHLQKLKAGLESDDDHLGAIGWGAVALMWFEENKLEEYKAALEELR